MSPTPYELRIALIGPWLDRFHKLFPKYDRKPQDLAEIADDFEAVLQDLSPNSIAAGFEQWRRDGKTFPTPADIRERAIESAKWQALNRKLPAAPTRLLPELTPEQQDEETERLRAEFREMWKKAKLRSI